VISCISVIVTLPSVRRVNGKEVYYEGCPNGGYIQRNCMQRHKVVQLFF
jgi:hypothetical protein